MARSKRFLWLVVATAMMAPGRARGKARSYASAGPPVPPQKQARRRSERVLQSLPAKRSPCGRHSVEVRAGSVFVDGRRVHPADGAVYLLAPPTFRRDGGAVAWLERVAGEVRLVVVPELGPSIEPLPWALPTVAGDDQIFWTGARRVVVGPAMLAPRAVASWSD
jgi:hypothetical protein